MNGSRGAATAFGNCAAYVDKLGADAPQPFAKQAPPQPFGQTEPVIKPVPIVPVQKQDCAKPDDGSI